MLGFTTDADDSVSTVLGNQPFLDAAVAKRELSVWQAEMLSMRCKCLCQAAIIIQLRLLPASWQRLAAHHISAQTRWLHHVPALPMGRVAREEKPCCMRHYQGSMQPNSAENALRELAQYCCKGAAWV